MQENYQETEEFMEPDEHLDAEVCEPYEAAGEGNREQTGDRPAAAPELRDHLMSLISQAEALKKEIPDFDLAQALTDAEFVRLTSPISGVSVKRAYAAIHADEIASRAAKISAEKLAAAIQSGARRPQEGGSSTAASLARPDPRHMSREQRMELRTRIRDAAARGEKIYPV